MRQVRKSIYIIADIEHTTCVKAGRLVQRPRHTAQMRAHMLERENVAFPENGPQSVLKISFLSQLTAFDLLTDIVVACPPAMTQV